MKAWTLTSTDDHLRLQDVPEPQLRGGGAVLRVIGVQIPAYTRYLTTGGRGDIPTPAVLGVGGIGEVEAVADDVFNVRPGDMVIATGLLPSRRLAEPEEVLLAWTGVGGHGRETDTTIGMRQLWRNGMFAERALMPAETLVALPGAEAYPHTERLTFLPWLCIAAAAVERAAVAAGQRVAIIGGSGQLGGAAALVALARGASLVIVVGRNTEALQRLAQVSPRITSVTATGDRAVDRQAITAIGGEVDAVIDALGAAPTADFTMAGYDALRPDGTMVLLGGVRQTLPIPYGDLMRRRITLRGSWMASPQTALMMWRAVASNTIDLSALDVTTVGLDDPDNALDLAQRTNGLRIVSLAPNPAAP